MKRILLLIFLLIPLCGFSQKTHKLNDFYNYYDQIVKKEYTEFYTNRDYRNKFCIDGKSLDCDSKYGMKRIKYWEKFFYDSLTNIRRVATEMVYTIGVNNNNIKVRQRALEDILNMYFIGSDHICEFNIQDFNKDDFTHKAKERIKVILSGEKNEIEIYLLAQTDMKFIMDDEWFKKVDKIVKNKELPYDYVLDSLKNVYFKNQIKYEKSQYRYSENLILLTGWLNMTDFIPDLEKMIDNPHQRFYITFEEMALARMGLKKYQNILLSKNDEIYDLLYINNLDIAKIFIAHYLNTDSLICCYSPCDKMIEISYSTYKFLQIWILNFPEKYKIDEYSYCEITDEDEIKYNQGKKWINDNIEDLKLDPNMWR